MARTPFTLKSGNATAFKNMGSYSPMMRVDAPTTTKKTGLGKLLGDVKSLVQNVGGKLKEGKKAADDRKKEQKEKDKARTGLDRMERQGKSQYQLDQMDAARARNNTKKGTTVVETPTEETVVETLKVQKGDYDTFTGKKGDKYKYRGKFHVDRNKKNVYEFQRPGSDAWEVATGKGRDAIRELYLRDDTKIEITPFYKKSPLEKGIGKYDKKAKGSRGYKMNK